GLRTALKEGEVDILHLVAHGYGGGVVLGDRPPAPAAVEAHELGEWCKDNKSQRLQMAFLQVCGASDVGGRGYFGGVTQELLSPEVGDLAAVIASPYPLDADKS